MDPDRRCHGKQYQLVVRTVIREVADNQIPNTQDPATTAFSQVKERADKIEEHMAIRFKKADGEGALTDVPVKAVQLGASKPSQPQPLPTSTKLAGKWGRRGKTRTHRAPQRDPTKGLQSELIKNTFLFHLIF